MDVKSKNLLGGVLCLFISQILLAVNLNAQSISPVENSINIDFRNQQITDIIYAVSDMCGASVYIDETVTGRMSFHFEDSTFEAALNRFSEYAGLYVEKKENVYFISKVHLEQKNNLFTVEAEDVPIEPLLILLSRKSHTTILYEKIPDVKITIRCRDVKIEEILNLVLVKLNGFTLEKVGSGFYISKNQSSQARRNVDSYVLTKNSDIDGKTNYSLKLQKANFINVLDDLFKKESREYSVINAKPLVIENLYYESKDFDTILSLVLEASNCDYKIQNEIYYIFEINKKDVMKKFKETKIIRLENINAESFMSLVPSELSSSEFVKLDKNTNSLIVTGSAEEIRPIENFISIIDVPLSGRYYQKFTLKNLSVKDALSSVPKSLFLSDAAVIPGTNSFVTQVTEIKEKEISEYLELIDRKQKAFGVKLKYIKSEDLLKYIPPSVNKDNIRETGDSSFIFFTGTKESYDDFLRELELIDKPKQQIRYQILVLQHQKNSGLNYSSGLSKIASAGSELAEGIAHSTSLYNLLNISFDIVSKFGIQFAGSLNAELSEGLSNVLADTTLNGISGQAISFSNTNIFRYRDIIRDNNEVYTSTAREISSGLTLSVNGWVSGDDMITVDVDAVVSKQGTVETSSSSGDVANPPSTSEKKVTTHVRTKSGTPVIIGGLLQEEKDVTVKKVPVIGSIPFLGLLFRSKVETVSKTELVIYLVPFVEKSGSSDFDFTKNIERFYTKYVREDQE